MRVHICNHELPKEIQHVTSKGGEYKGIRFIVEQYEHGPDDDDSSSVIFWYRGEEQKVKLKNALEEAIAKLG